MITFAYLPTNSTTPVIEPLLDGDRYWPADLTYAGSGLIQTVTPIDAISQLELPRGNRSVLINFTASRQWASFLASNQYCADLAQRLAGTRGTLLLQYPGGGQLRSINCVCLEAAAFPLGIRSTVRWSFRGPKPTP